MVELFVVRHGKTKANDSGLILGWSDSPLLRESFSEIQYLTSILNMVDFDLIIHSDIGRARKTAEIIHGCLNLKPEIIEDSLLREVSYGEFSGKKKKEVKDKNPEYHRFAFFKNPQGESFVDMYNRIEKFLDGIIGLKNNKRILVVTHAGPFRAIYSYFKDESIQNNISMKINHLDVLRCVYNNGCKKVKLIKIK